MDLDSMPRILMSRIEDINLGWHSFSRLTNKLVLDRTAGTLEWTPLWLDLRRAVIALRKENDRLIQLVLQQRDE